MATTDFAAWVQACQARIESVLADALPSSHVAPQRLHDAMRYAVLGGGKRVRPLLAFAAGEVTAADPARVEHAAAAVELIHAYSLVHDDMPAMDDDALRRGKPTVHVEFDEATALLVGDALQSLAFDLLASHTLADDAVTQLKMVQLLAQAAGSRGMAGGQAIDLASVGKPLDLTELEFMHIHKTGALIRAAVLLGAQCGRASEHALGALDHYAKCIGLAFQVVDDVLDAEASTATLGKTAGKDAAHNKPTYVSLLGAARARELAQELRADAHAALDTLGAPAVRLRQLADFVVERTF
ncbi:polyprenyl synthetase family protein [Thiobacillus sedimenti]|uniref:Farnesyl diphosphate synthase n=1 Tax=Thiobacillus sedimenti TaxID=3110231 RepID=A0ABZ1CLK5_9PROT|nr:farnesyl diphosphate synthase [Thiobacillus sp. SCUT-2]WRS40146.1 farnesyl diphosphate synthase [Thiobacillus sp. SCUT-2]